MKRIVSSIILALAVVVTSIGVSGAVSAQSTPVNQSSTRCTTAQARIAQRITSVESVRTAQSGIYESLLDKVDAIILSAEAEGYDVTQLTTAVNSVQIRLTNFTDRAAAYDTALKAIQDIDCATSATDLTAAVIAARTAMVETRSATLETRSAFRNEVIPALREYAAWLETQNDTVEGESDES